MQINILIFGQLTDITGRKKLIVNEVDSTDKLVHHLNTIYPDLVNKKYLIAVEKEIISSDTILNDNDTVAFLPPYAGG